jgi:hypothetical protein
MPFFKASLKKAGTCERFFSNAVADGTYRNLFVDWQFRTADWQNRFKGIEKPDFSENPWSVANYSHDDLYADYQKSLKARHFHADNNISYSCLSFKRSFPIK